MMLPPLYPDRSPEQVSTGTSSKLRNCLKQALFGLPPKKRVTLTSSQFSLTKFASQNISQKKSSKPQLIKQLTKVKELLNDHIIPKIQINGLDEKAQRNKYFMCLGNGRNEGPQKHLTTIRKKQYGKLPSMDIQLQNNTTMSPLPLFEESKLISIEPLDPNQTMFKTKNRRMSFKRKVHSHEMSGYKKNEESVSIISSNKLQPDVIHRKKQLLN